MNYVKLIKKYTNQKNLKYSKRLNINENLYLILDNNDSIYIRKYDYDYIYFNYDYIYFNTDINLEITKNMNLYNCEELEKINNTLSEVKEFFNLLNLNDKLNKNLKINTTIKKVVKI